MRVALFCGARAGLDPRYRRITTDATHTLVQAGHSIVYGGGNIGLMGAIADAAISVGGDIVGVIPASMVEEELAHHGISRLEVVHTMHERKARMAELADAFIALPGGYGTLDEIFEIITWKQLQLHQKPIGFLNSLGYFDELLVWIDKAVAAGFVPDKHGRLFVAEQEMGTLLNRMLSLHSG